MFDPNIFALAHFLEPLFTNTTLAPSVGLEPTTPRLTRHCHTTKDIQTTPPPFSEVAILTQKMRNVLKNYGRKIACQIMSRLGTTWVQKGHFGRPKIQLSSKVALIFCMDDICCAILGLLRYARFCIFFLWDLTEI